MTSSSNVSGMAASIRKSVESETFDLAGQNVTTIAHMVHDAFAEPFVFSKDHAGMIRITLVTGAGKLGRQKYDENAAKAVTTALREVGFQEDRAASCVVECAGTFKLQHDTGKNLKTIVVFPKVSSNNNTASSSSSNGNNHHHSSTSGIHDGLSNLNLNNGNGNNNNQENASSLVPGLTREQWKALTTPSSKAVFKKMMDSKCPSWIQKRQCLQFLDQIKQHIDDLDQKLCKGTVLTDAEQAFYDGLSLPTLEEKQAIVKDQMHHLVEQGQITVEEKRLLLSQVTERNEHLTKEIAAATTAGAKARLEKLQALRAKAMERKNLLDRITSQPPHALRHEADIRKLRKELQPLLELEASTKGRLLSIKETQTLARKDEILQEITELENASRGWFEDDALFKARVQASRYAWNTLVKQANKKKPTTTTTTASSSSSSNNKSSVAPWATNKPVARPSTAAAKPATAPKATKSAANNRGGSVFAAMMMDSDSD